MPTQIKVGAFTFPTSGTVEVTSVGFRPKAYIAFGTASPSTGSANEAFLHIGFADGTTQRCVGAWANDAVGTTAHYRWFDDEVLHAKDVASSHLNTYTNMSAVHSAFNSDGMTFTASTYPDAETRCGYVAFGGDDISNVGVDSITMSGSTGEVDYTGLGFTPDLLIFLPISLHAPPPTYGSWNQNAIGFVTSEADQSYSAWMAASGASTSNNHRHQKTGSCIVSINSSGVSSVEAEFVRMIPGGFRLNWTDAGDGNDQVAVLGIRGCQAKMISAARPATNSDQSVAGVGFHPVGSVFKSSSTTVGQSTVIDHCIVSFGGASSPTESCCGTFIEEDGQSTSDASRLWQETMALQNASGNGATYGDMTLKSFDPDGATVTWANTTSDAYEWNGLMVGNSGKRRQNRGDFDYPSTRTRGLGRVGAR